MAKVELVRQEEKKPEWVPFVTLTLSKREAAGILKAIGVFNCHVTVGDTYENLLDAFRNEGESGVVRSIPSPEQGSYDDNEITSMALDEKFGPV